MKDRILEFYKMVKNRPYTIKELEVETKSSTSFVWTKVYALKELGKIELREGKKGHWIAYPKSSMGIEAAEKQALKNLEAIQKLRQQQPKKII